MGETLKDLLDRLDPATRRDVSRAAQSLLDQMDAGTWDPIGGPASAVFAERVRAIHADHYGCRTWEMWTDRKVPPQGGGPVVVVHDGCREHRVSVARP